jgi:hypothetical protein
MDSLADGIHKYTQTWYQLDQRYRKFVYHARESGQASLLQALNQQVENLYNNNYLSRLNVRWQQWVDSCQTWAAHPVVSQSKFFSHFVQPYLDRKGTRSSSSSVSSAAPNTRSSVSRVSPVLSMRL